jgi:tetratricopeptide (TPR) repeat protein
MSFPPQSQVPQQQDFAQSLKDAQQPKRRRIAGIVWLVVLAMIVSTAITQGPREVGRWHLAKAIKLRGEGEKEAAYQELAAAMKGLPDRPELVLQRAEWEIDDGEKEKALADIDKCLEKAGNELQWMQVHSLFLQNSGEFKRGVEDWKKIEKFSKRSGSPPRASALNGLAYAQALANVELDEALANINQALELASNEPALLDTRGFIFYRRGEHEESLKDMDRAVKGMDEYVDAVRRKYGEDAVAKPVGKIMVDSKPRTLRELQPEPSARSRYETAVRSAAVGHYHRALVLAALDRKEEAEKDMGVARELIGKEPDEMLF